MYVWYSLQAVTIGLENLFLATFWDQRARYECSFLITDLRMSITLTDLKEPPCSVEVWAAYSCCNVAVGLQSICSDSTLLSNGA